MRLFDRLKGVGSQIDAVAQPKSFKEKGIADMDELVEAVEAVAKNAEEQKTYYETTIMPMVLAEEKKLQDQAPVLLASFDKDHQAQLDGYSFSCTRHGDFLAVFITREANAFYPKNPNRDSDVETKHSLIINLGKVTTITKREGHPPDLKGVTTYSLYAARNDNQSWVYSGHADDPNIPPGPGLKHGITHNVDLHIRPRLFVTEMELPPKQVGRRVLRYRNTRITHETTGIPRQAEDDCITFNGHGTSIFIPFGKIGEVENTILEALGKGFEPKGIAAELQE